MFGIIYYSSFIMVDLSASQYWLILRHIQSQAIYIYLLFIVMKCLLHVFLFGNAVISDKLYYFVNIYVSYTKQENKRALRLS